MQCRGSRLKRAGTDPACAKGETMLDAALTTAIMSAVDTGFDEQVALTAELVRFPSGRGAEHTAQDFVAAELRRRGLAVDRWRIDVDAIRHMPGFSPVH